MLFFAYLLPIPLSPTLSSLYSVLSVFRALCLSFSRSLYIVYFSLYPCVFTLFVYLSLSVLLHQFSYFSVSFHLFITIFIFNICIAFSSFSIRPWNKHINHTLIWVQLFPFPTSLLILSHPGLSLSLNYILLSPMKAFVSKMHSGR